MSHRIIRIALLAIALGCITACRDTTQFRPSVDSLQAASGRRRIDSVRSRWGLTGRSVLTLPAGDCIVLHYPCSLMEQVDLSAMLRDLAATLEGDPSTKEDNGELFFEEGSPWCSGAGIGDPASTFNCCTFAVGDLVGLTVGDWIAPNPSGDTNDTVPMQVILDSYFRLIEVYKTPIEDWRVLEQDRTLQEDDLLCYVRARAPVAEFSHAGRIWKKDGMNWLVSKIGKGPIVRATIQSTAIPFADDFDEIRVYRRNVEPKT